MIIELHNRAPHFAWEERSVQTHVIDEATEALAAHERANGLGEDPIVQDYRSRLRLYAEAICSTQEIPMPGETRLWVNPQARYKTPDNSEKPSFSIVTWNIERGHKESQQIQYLRRLIQGDPPDILCLQEVDLYCHRTLDRNVALNLASALGYKYCAFTTEFIEIDSPEKYPDKDDAFRRDFPGNQRWRDGIGRAGGAIGQVVLSKYPIDGFETIKLHKLWYDLENPHNPYALAAPMMGGRIAQKLKVRVGDRTMTIYNCHFENEAGPTGRVENYRQVRKNAEDESDPCIILGDFNTVGHGWGNRVSEESLYSVRALVRGLIRGTRSGRDPLQRFRERGETEAEFWERTQLADGGFTDPFDPKLSTFKMGPFFKGKLDWVLLEDGNFLVNSSRAGTDQLSDHRPLIVEAQLI